MITITIKLPPDCAIHLADDVLPVPSRQSTWTGLNRGNGNHPWHESTSRGREALRGIPHLLALSVSGGGCQGGLGNETECSLHSLSDTNYRKIKENGFR